jgi:serine/threonine-protein kinase
MSATPQPGHPAASLDSQIDAICDRFEGAWKAGQRPSLEQHLGELPAAERAALLQELLKLDLYYRRRQGELPTQDDYRPRFPNDADVLQQVFISSRADPNATIHHNPVAVGPWPPAAGGPRYVPRRSYARGGQGEVYLARDEELCRDVALKRIQDRWAGDGEYRRRFVAEATITGRLEHPGVVPVYGLVQDGNGEPCYAMRFIDGETLQDAIQRYHAAAPPGRGPGEHGLDLRQLLSRFVTVCNTVAYAHSRGVIHRDLKPQNVMLGKYGETLVIDWGMARPFERDEPARATGETTPVPAPQPTPPSEVIGDGGAAGTRAGVAVGTPAYMSPEQARGDLDRIGPASDIFGLGAILYALLTNRPPFDGRSRTAVMEQARRGEIPSPRSIRRGVPPALEAACLKAMAPRPAERYGSALDLAAEVERWLADEPVSAYREPGYDRLRRWGRQHRPLVAGAAALSAMVVVLLVALNLHSERARRTVKGERDAKENERQRAVTARKRTREALDAMTAEVTGVVLMGQPTLSAEQRTFLEGVLKFYEEFAAEPGEDREGLERLARAHLRLGAIRYRLGHADSGVTVLRRAVELYARLAVDESGVPECRRDLAHSYNALGTLLRDLGRHTEAEAAFQAARVVGEKLAADFPRVAEYRSKLADSRNNLGVIWANRGRNADAAAAFRAALALRETVAADAPGVPMHWYELAETKCNLGNQLALLGKQQEAEAALRAVLAVEEKLAVDARTAPIFRRVLARTNRSLGNLQFGQGKAVEAETAHRSAVTLLEKLAADFPGMPEYRNLLAASHNDLGVLLSNLGRRVEAEAEFRAGLALQEKLAADGPTVPEYHLGIALSRRNLGDVHRRMGKRAEAEAEFRAALGIYSKLAADHAGLPGYRNYLADSHCLLGSLLADLGKRAEAEAEFRAALGIYSKLAADHAGVPEYRGELAFTHNSLGVLLERLGRRAEAEVEYRRAATEQARLVAEHPRMLGHAVQLGGYYCNLGNCLRDGGDSQTALDWYGQAIAILEPVVRQDGQLITARRFLRNAHWGRARTLSHMARLTDALAEWDRAIALDDGSARGPLRLGRAATLARADDPAKAVAEADDLADAKGTSARTLYDCARVQALASAAASGDVASAEKYAGRAVKLLREAFTKGFTDAAHMQRDGDLAPLRGRADFAELLWDLADRPALAK